MTSKTQVAQATEDVTASPLNSSELGRINKLLSDIRASVNQLPADIGAELTALLATVEGHLSAEPPNAVATAEALALIRDELRKAADSKLAVDLVARLDPVLRMLKEPPAP
jgi:hypothetical protein